MVGQAAHVSCRGSRLARPHLLRRRLRSGLRMLRRLLAGGKRVPTGLPPRFVQGPRASAARPPAAGPRRRDGCGSVAGLHLGHGMVQACLAARRAFCLPLAHCCPCIAPAASPAPAMLPVQWRARRGGWRLWCTSWRRGRATVRRRSGAPTPRCGRLAGPEEWLVQSPSTAAWDGIHCMGALAPLAPVTAPPSPSPARRQVAFDATGAPTPALLGFCKKNGVTGAHCVPSLCVPGFAHLPACGSHGAAGARLQARPPPACHTIPVANHLRICINICVLPFACSAQWRTASRRRMPRGWSMCGPR